MVFKTSRIGIISLLPKVPNERKETHNASEAQNHVARFFSPCCCALVAPDQLNDDNETKTSQIVRQFREEYKRV